jgi:hypothetical protein
VSAILETTIAWEGSRGSRTAQAPPERYLVTLSQPLNNRFGGVASWRDDVKFTSVKSQN